VDLLQLQHLKHYPADKGQRELVYQPYANYIRE
jgi:hypothetical protein